MFGFPNVFPTQKGSASSVPLLAPLQPWMVVPELCYSNSTGMSATVGTIMTLQSSRALLTRVGQFLRITVVGAVTAVSAGNVGFGINMNGAGLTGSNCLASSAITLTQQAMCSFVDYGHIYVGSFQNALTGAVTQGIGANSAIPGLSAGTQLAFTWQGGTGTTAIYQVITEVSSL